MVAIPGLATKPPYLLASQHISSLHPHLVRYLLHLGSTLFLGLFHIFVISCLINLPIFVTWCPPFFREMNLITTHKNHHDICLHYLKSKFLHFPFQSNHSKRSDSSFRTEEFFILGAFCWTICNFSVCYLGTVKPFCLQCGEKNFAASSNTF